MVESDHVMAEDDADAEFEQAAAAGQNYNIEVANLDPSEVTAA